METADEQPHKRQGSELTQFQTLQPSHNSVLLVLTDCVAKLEGETDEIVAIVAAKLKSEVVRLEFRLTDFRSNTNNHFTTQKREIGSMSDDLADITHRVLKLEDGLLKSKIRWLPSSRP